MAGFESPLETWNARFAREDFLFGEEPNAFLVSESSLRRPLCLSTGRYRRDIT